MYAGYHVVAAWCLTEAVYQCFDVYLSYIRVEGSSVNIMWFHIQCITTMAV